MLPYATITEAADRRWTARLLDRLTSPGLPAGERGEVVAALVAVSDRRAVPVLERVLADPSEPPETREAAGDVLRDMEHLNVEWPDAVLRGWWHGGDPVLRRHALLSMDAADCPDIVRAVAAEPGHPLRTAALGRMTFFFDAPADLRLKVAALADPDPAVRETAAAVLFWDEPVAAEDGLIAAAGDAVADVAAEAAAALQYYPTTRAVRRLHGLLGHPADRVRAAARGSFGEVRDDCLRGLPDPDPRVAAHVRQWLNPVWDLLSVTPADLSPPAGGPYTPPPAEERRPPGVADVLALLADPDASPKVLSEVLWASGWGGYPAADRRRLRPVLLGHPDPLVRDRATVPLEEWGDAGGLLALAGDPDFGVRKVATYRLGLLPPDPGVAAFAWGRLSEPGVFGVHAAETLGTFAAHAAPAEAAPRLESVAADRGRPENVRVAAVHSLARLRAAGEVGRLAGVLHEPPAVTWSLHLAVLDAASDLEVALPDIGDLGGVDNLAVQAAVAGVLP